MDKQEHLLTILGEECSELHQDICKALRFGMNDKGPDNKLDNTQLMFKEFNDILAMADMINEYVTSMPWSGVTYTDKGILYRDDKMVQKKKDKVEKYLAYSKEKGTLI